MKAKKLIEVAMPIKEISAESVRDKSIRHGHISTLHLWWARRPLPTCRAVVFASLVPDPLDPNCPQAFKDAVEDILCTGIAKNIYAPYPDIPYTVIFDPMEDNLRNRLLMFIGKFSEKCQANMIAGKSTPPKGQLQDGCLIKWESKNDETVLNRARKLIWVAYNAQQNPDLSYAQLSKEFDASWTAIKEAESKLYSTPNRHIASPVVDQLEADVKSAIDAFQSRMPSVFDPFAGGGAIPLEAARLGCRSYGNDINPVAHIIEKGSVEFPQKYGKPITYTRDEFMKLYGEEGLNLLQERGLEFMADEVTIPNRLSFDVEYYANKLINKTKQEIGDIYSVADSTIGEPLVFYWARMAKCSNPSCNANVPFLKQFYISKRRGVKSDEYVYLMPQIQGTDISFNIAKGNCTIDGWNNRGNLVCPCCGSITPAAVIKKDYNKNGIKDVLLTIISEKDGKRLYTIPSRDDIKKAENILKSPQTPTEQLEIGNVRNFNTPGWSISTFDGLFSNRQSEFLVTLSNNIKNIQEIIKGDENYVNAIVTYMALLFDRILCRNTSFGVWHKLQETVEHPFGRQAIPMTFDYPEMNPFSDLSGACNGQLESIINYIENEHSFMAQCNNVLSGDIHQFGFKSLTAVVTDPPYYDAIAYADLSDFFYVWLKRIIGDLYPIACATPKTPKSEECTALKHHHNNDENTAKKHFENKLTEIFSSIEYQTTDMVSVMFAHQSTEAWTTLCNSLLASNLNLKGSWAMDTEVSIALKADKDTLESSVTVACTPSERKGYGSYKKVKQAIQHKVEEEVKSLYDLGFRGADLLTACFGKAVSEFGNYEHVEKADGSEVTVAELLDMARTAAFTALIRDFASDDYTKFYIGWLQLNGMGETDYDDATKFTRAGMNVNIGDIFAHDILVKNETGNTQHLGSYKERAKHTLYIPTEEAPLIDKVHYAMYYWKDEDRGKLLQLIAAYGQDINNEFWRVFTVLKELLPEGDDREQVVALLNNAETLIKASKSGTVKAVQGTFDFGE